MDKVVKRDNNLNKHLEVEKLKDVTAASDPRLAVNGGIMSSGHLVLVPDFVKTEADSYFSVIKPVLVILQALGRFPYSFTSTGVNKLKMISLPVVYCGLFFLGEALLTLKVLSKLDRMLLKTHSLNEYIYWIGGVIQPCVNFVVPFTTWWTAPKLVRYISLWDKLQAKYRYKLKLRRVVLIWSLTWVPLRAGISQVHFYLMTASDEPLLYLPYIPIVLSNAAYECLWAGTLFQIRSIADQLYQRTLKKRCCCLEETRQAWLRLSELMTELGDALGVVYLAIIVAFFVNCLVTSYGCICYLVFGFSKASRFFVSIALNMVMSFMYIGLMVDSAHRTSQAVGAKFLYKLLKLDFSSIRHEDRFQVSLLLRTLAYSNPQLNLSGFVVVSRQLFVSFLIQLVTFLVVLMQFMDKSFPQVK